MAATAESITEVEAANQSMTQGSRKRSQVKQVMKVGMRSRKGFLHFVSNSVLPGAVVTSDFLTFLELMEHGDIG